MATDESHPQSASDVHVLSPNAGVQALKQGEKYLAEVNNTKQFGVFVSLTPQKTTDLTGLVHESELPPLTKPRDYAVGERCVVSVLEATNPEKLSFSLLYSENQGQIDGPIPDVNVTDPSRENGVDSVHVDARDAQRDEQSTDSPETAPAMADGDEIVDRIDTLENAVGKLTSAVTALTDRDENDDHDGAMGISATERITSPTLNVADSLVEMYDEGFTAESVERSQDGEQVEFTVTLSPPEESDNE